MKHLLLLFLFATAASLCGAAPLAAAQAPLLDHYGFNLTMNSEKGTLTGQVKLQVDSRNYPDHRLYLNLPLNQTSAKNPKIYGPLQDFGPEGFSPSWAAVTQIKVAGIPQETVYLQKPPVHYWTVNLEKTFIIIDCKRGRFFVMKRA